MWPKISAFPIQTTPRPVKITRIVCKAVSLAQSGPVIRTAISASKQFLVAPATKIVPPAVHLEPRHTPVIKTLASASNQLLGVCRRASARPTVNKPRTAVINLRELAKSIPLGGNRRTTVIRAVQPTRRCTPVIKLPNSAQRPILADTPSTSANNSVARAPPMLAILALTPANSHHLEATQMSSLATLRARLGIYTRVTPAP